MIDVYPRFAEFWNAWGDMGIDARLDRWASETEKASPELFRKLVDSYASDGADWRAVAAERVFPGIAARGVSIHEAHRNALEVAEPACRRAAEALDYGGDLIVVLYVGIGCGAGWATQFDGKPAVLIGLENVAECGWADAESLTGLIAHEVGHIVHAAAHRNGPINDGPWRRLYEEGFAQYCEFLVLGSERFHQASREGWLEWCEANLPFLASSFIEQVDRGESTTPFFASWESVAGWSETGYYLGYRFVRELAERRGVAAAANITDPENALRKAAEQIVRSASASR